MPNTQNLKTIDATPEWQGIIPIYLQVLQNEKASDKGKQSAVKEITRMAVLCDMYNAITKNFDRIMNELSLELKELKKRLNYKQHEEYKIWQAKFDVITSLLKTENNERG